MEKVTVSAAPLRQLLQALIGPDHYIRELQYTRGGSARGLSDDNPIDILIAEYNAAVEMSGVPSGGSQS